MSEELLIHFDTPTQFKIRYQDDETELLSFNSPLADAEYQEIRWYLEEYPTQYTHDPDDTRAQKVVSHLPIWGEQLFNAIFTDATAHRFFTRLQDSDEKERYITLSSVLPEILSLPWEVLKDPHGVYLCHENPRIAIRRSLKTKAGGRASRKVKAKSSLRILFIISRPEGAGFIDPRAEAQAILHSLQGHEIQQIELEFLPQATLKMLVERLENDQLPPVDIVHFDGHGTFDGHGKVDSRTIDSEMTKEGSTEIKHMGYLLFETEKGEKDLISANKLGEILHRQQISMMVLSACQSATVAGDDAMSSVAARLVHAGIPSVLAMTHSVLVITTELLFRQFYQEIAKGKHVGEAVENARRALFMDTKRHTKRFGEREVVVKLQDWFIPSLYQMGNDTPLLKPEKESTVSPPSVYHKLPTLQEVGFFGRTKELWDIECWLRTTKRVTITGFGGQGKTYLATELARWLLQKQWFESAVFVNYHAFQGVDAVSLAISTMGQVWNQSLINNDAAQAELKKRPTLLILDNVESLEPKVLHELFDAAAQWSEIGATRVVVTTRPDIAMHPLFPHTGSYQHRVLNLDGLRADDAVKYLQHLLAMPPEEKVDATYNELIRLLKTVRNHPLSINLIAQLLRTMRWQTVETRLRELMVAKENPVVASLQLSLARLDAEVVAWLPKLGVFQGGALWGMLPHVTELSEEQLSKLLKALITTGLIHPHPIPETNTIYFEFHPTLAPVLWTRLTEAQQQELRQRYQQVYYELSRYFHAEDQRNPVLIRTLVKLELSNLLAAVKGALQAGSAEAVEFVECVNKFLGNFGLTRDRAVLTQQAQQLAGEVGSQNWYLSHSNQAQQCYDAGRYAEAVQVYQQLLAQLPPGGKRCSTLGRLGRCLNEQGQAEHAVACYQQELTELAQLEQDDWAIREKSTVYTDLADALTDMGQFDAAKQAYLQSLAIVEDIADHRAVAVANGQLGTLALLQGELAEAEQRYQAALAIFEQYHEPSTEAAIWHQLGVVYQKAKQWDAAETAYRRAAHLKETQGRLQSAATTWNQLAVVAQLQGKWTEAEQWLRKAVAGFKTAGDNKNYATGLNNLANLLQQDPARLSEARDLATQALAINKTLDPAAAEIWKSYGLLAQITAQQGDLATAGAYRRLSREAKLNYAGTRYELEREHRDLIAAAVHGGDVEAELQRYKHEGWNNLKIAIRQILAGERDVEVLCEPLNYGEAPIVLMILEGLADPSRVAWLSEE